MVLLEASIVWVDKLPTIIWLNQSALQHAKEEYDREEDLPTKNAVKSLKYDVVHIYKTC